MNSRIVVFKQFLIIIIGLLVFSYGVHLTMAANLGVAPWDVLGQGIEKHTSLNYGLSMTFVSVVILIIDLIIKQPIGYGTVFDALLTGNLIQFYNDNCSFTNNLINQYLCLKGVASVFASCLMIILGMIIMALGQLIYMNAKQSCGPRDALMVGLGKKIPIIPIGIMWNFILLIVFIIGWALGGSVGLGTVILVLGTGLFMDAVFKIFKFEPRNVSHMNIIESTKILIGKNKAH